MMNTKDALGNESKMHKLCLCLALTSVGARWLIVRLCVCDMVRRYTNFKLMSVEQVLCAFHPFRIALLSIVFGIVCCVSLDLFFVVCVGWGIVEYTTWD